MLTCTISKNTYFSRKRWLPDRDCFCVSRRGPASRSHRLPPSVARERRKRLWPWKALCPESPGCPRAWLLRTSTKRSSTQPSLEKPAACCRMIHLGADRTLGGRRQSTLCRLLYSLRSSSYRHSTSRNPPSPSIRTLIPIITCNHSNHRNYTISSSLRLACMLHANFVILNPLLLPPLVS